MTTYPSPLAALAPRLTLFARACEAAAASAETWTPDPRRRSARELTDVTRLVL